LIEVEPVVEISQVWREGWLVCLVFVTQPVLTNDPTSTTVRRVCCLARLMLKSYLRIALFSQFSDRGCSVSMGLCKDLGVRSHIPYAP